MQKIIIPFELMQGVKFITVDEGFEVTMNKESFIEFSKIFNASDKKLVNSPATLITKAKHVIYVDLLKMCCMDKNGKKITKINGEKIDFDSMVQGWLKNGIPQIIELYVAKHEIDTAKYAVSIPGFWNIGVKNEGWMNFADALPNEKIESLDFEPNANDNVRNIVVPKLHLLEKETGKEDTKLADVALFAVSHDSRAHWSRNAVFYATLHADGLSEFQRTFAVVSGLFESLVSDENARKR